MHHFLDDHSVTLKTKGGSAERRDQGEVLKTRFFPDLADRRFEKRFIRLLMSFGECPTLKRIFDKKNFNRASAAAENNPSA